MKTDNTCLIPECLSHRVNGEGKGREVGACLACLQNSKQTCTAGAVSGGRAVGGEVRELLVKELAAV